MTIFGTPSVNSLPNKPWFFLYVSAVQVLKTMWKKEKLLLTSNFSFTHNVFHPFGEFSTIFKFEFVVCKLFQFGKL